jgi:fructan beta-fructosidase
MRDDFDQFRPTFHFTPEAHWMNDPNGLVYSRGLYHLFYQFYPEGVVWGPMHWGHATSRDLVTWERLPVAFRPDENGWIFSGSAVEDVGGSAGFGPGALVAAFTLHDGEARKRGVVGVENQGLGFSRDGGRTWEKYAGNPVLRNSGEADFRDPKLVRHPSGAGWNLVLAAGDRIKIYSSKNLRDWRHESDFFPDATGFGVWECPDLFPIRSGDETRWVMLLSQTAAAPNGGSGTRYLVGDFDGSAFSARTPLAWIDWGKDFYAAVTYSGAPEEKSVLVGWMSNWQYAAKTPTGAWRGAMALPRELALETRNGRYHLTQKPVAGFEALPKRILAERSGVLPVSARGLDLSAADITVSVREPRGPFVVELSNEKGERFSIECDGTVARVDRTRSGAVDFSPDFAPGAQTLKADYPLFSLRIIVDACSVEIFFDGGASVMTNLVFPSEPYGTVSVTGSVTGSGEVALTVSAFSQ